ENASHPKHSPRPIECFLDAALVANDTRIQLHQCIPHLTHPFEELIARNEVAIEALNGRACKRHGCDRNQLPDAGHDPVTERHRFADNDGRAAIPLPSPCDNPSEIPRYVCNHFAKLRDSRGATAALPCRQLAEQRSILQHPIVVDRHRNYMNARLVRSVPSNAEDVVEQTDLRRLQPAVTGEAALEENPLRHTFSGDPLDVTLENRVVEGLAILATDEIGPKRLEQMFERKCARPFAD